MTPATLAAARGGMGIWEDRRGGVNFLTARNPFRSISLID